jgi:two-component system, cell cycle sensor histidine kinase and response regulator CckA
MFKTALMGERVYRRGCFKTYGNGAKSMCFTERNFITTLTLMLILLFQAFWPFSLQGAETVRVGIMQNKPLSFLDAQGVAQGIYPDVVREIADREKWEVKFVNDSWSGCLERLKSGGIDLMISIVFSKERDEIFDFSKEAVVTAWGQVYTNKDSNISSILDLEGKTVAVMAKDINGRNFIDLCSKFNVKCNFIEVAIYEDVCESFLSKKADAGVINSLNGSFLKRKYDIYPTPIMFNPVSASFAVSEGKNQALLAAIDSYLSRWRKDKGSVYYEILNKWYGNLKEGYALPYKIIATIIIVSAGISFFLFIWNSMLKRQVKTRTNELRRSEERYRLIVENQNDLIVKLDHGGRLLFVSPKYCETFGKTEEALIGKPFVSMIHEDDRESVARSLEKLNREPHAGYHQERALTGDGWRWFAWSDKTVLNDAGDVVEIIAVGRDITDRKDAESAMQTVVESTAQTLGQDFFDNIVRILCQWLGCDMAIIGELTDDLAIRAFAMQVDRNVNHDFNYTLVGSPCEKAFSKGYCYYPEKVAEAFPEDKGLVEFGAQGYVGTPINDSHGRPIGILNAISRTKLELPERAQEVLNIIAARAAVEMERMHAEKALRESEERYRVLVEDSVMGFYQVEKQGGYRLVNRRMADILGYASPEEFLADIDNAAKLYARPEERFSILQQVDDKGFVEGVELEFKKKTGGTGWVKINTRLTTDRDGTAIYEGTLEDITGQKLMEAEHKRWEDQLQQASKMEAIGTLAGGIAHDFNNILTPIIIQSELALMDVEDDNPVWFSLQEVKKAGHRAKDLVKQILTFSRQTEQQPVPLRATPIIKEAIKLLRSSLPATVDIRLDIQGGEDTIMADPTQIHQVLMNLCTNAAHAMKEKGGILNIALCALGENPGITDRYPGLGPGPYLKLTVSDTGHGIPAELRDRIFDPFFTTKGRAEGTGMGLAVVHGIVKGYGGEISVESEPGKGAAFNVFIPQVKVPVSDESGIAEIIPHGVERVLIVDDEKIMVDTLQSLLNRLGYKTASRTSSLETLELFRKKPGHFDLVITDMTMPNMTGDELAEKILEIRPDIPIIICTGFSERIDGETAKQNGIKALVMKPIVVRDIAHTIRKVLDG